jgi:hypothetical protein
MGLFGIHMPMLYGEGDNAFRQLQEEIMRRTPDDSIFAWKAPDGSLSRYCGLLAMSPDDFEGSQGIEQGRGQFATSSLGLRIEARFCPLLDEISGEMWDDSIFALPLGAIEKGRIIALLIRRLSASHYTRVAANTFSHRLNDNGKPEAIYIEHTPKIPKIFRSRAMHCFQFKFDSTVYRIRSAQPKQLWDPIHSDLSIDPEFCTNNSSDNNGYPGAPVFYGTVRLYYQNRNFPLACSINFGHNLVTGRVWLKLLGSASTPVEPNWRTVCQEPKSYDELLRPEPLVQVLNISNSEAVRVTVHYGLHRGMISYIVHIVQQKYMLPPVLRT